MIIYISGLIAIAVFSVTGVIAAEKKGMDIFSVVVLGLITALAGGTIRDVILAHNPVFWIADTNYLWISCVASVFFFFFARIPFFSYKILLIADAIGVSMFNIQALDITLQMNYPGEIAILMGIITGIAGGIMRDVLTQEKPLLLKRELYATPLLIGGITYLLLKKLGIPNDIVFWSGIISALVIRIAAIRYDLCFPEFLIYKSHRDNYRG